MLSEHLRGDQGVEGVGDHPHTAIDRELLHEGREEGATPSNPSL